MTAAQAKAQKLPGTQPAADSNGFCDLDAYQAEARKEPFRFRLGGAEFELPHMSDMDWQVAIGDDGIEAPTGHELLRKAIGDRWDEFVGLKLTAGGYSELQRRWHKHSGIDLGEDAASPGSSDGTAGQ